MVWTCCGSCGSAVSCKKEAAAAAAAARRAGGKHRAPSEPPGSREGSATQRGPPRGAEDPWSTAASRVGQEESSSTPRRVPRTDLFLFSNEEEPRIGRLGSFERLLRDHLHFPSYGDYEAPVRNQACVAALRLCCEVCVHSHFRGWLRCRFQFKRPGGRLSSAHLWELFLPPCLPPAAKTPAMRDSYASGVIRSSSSSQQQKWNQDMKEEDTPWSQEQEAVPRGKGQGEAQKTSSCRQDERGRVWRNGKNMPEA
ncbi:uncharacterized protein LOC143272212 [Peromyscus maniculatus bairdii]|uniref:uncharacterized protein LOC143272212 n=1 Tax=Peromyscus maniculatus bairdii TaxID=230844 RepID=UPI003FD67C41